MIDHVLNRDRVLGAAIQLLDTAQPAGGDEARALEALEASVAAQPPLGDATDAESLKAFIPTDDALALLQALHEQHLEQQRPETLTTIAEPSGPLASRTVSSVGQAEGLDDKFSSLDPRWVGSFVAALAKYTDDRRRFKLPAEPPRPQPLAANARVILVGDWGTGEGVADEVADGVRAELADAGDRETHVVHLGDVYYAGTPWEAEHRFLAHWPVDPGDATRHRSWCLNANHDMYAAAEGLFDVILEDERFALQRTTAGAKTSELQLAGEHWQILGLDSAWRFDATDLRGHAGNFGPQQEQWLLEHVRRNGPGTILLSHHQPFTRKEPGAGGIENVGNLMAMTAPVRDEPGVDAWIWGHEHRLFTYGSRAGIGYAACCGHGAIPSTPKDEVAGPGEWEYREVYEDDEGDNWLVSGFIVLDLAGDEIGVRYINQFGEPCREPDVIRRP